ncbi:MAG: hypothetical protein IC227_07940 [Enterococcus lacertideformus]|uniref:Pesticidal crystal protein Cry1Aa domain-containing protein n=1 Tax=Enterococcus lacertideformus TaxID=2771493 RepID=A0A931F8W0_9ENTE|nr:hypothetical protein [Enterococcus lacertideformus]
MKKHKLLLFASLICIGTGTINAISVQADQQATYLNSDAQNAITAVDNLYTDQTHTVLSPKTTPQSIQNAKKLILKAAGKCDIIALNKLCTQAETLLRQSTVSEDSAVQKAVTAVDNLFTDQTHTVLSSKTTPQSIQNAKKLILKAAGKCDIIALNKLCTQAETLLIQSTVSEDSAVQKAVTAVDDLFTDQTHTTLSPKTTAESIQNAKKLILKAVGKCDIVYLSQLCNQAENLLLHSKYL